MMNDQSWRPLCVRLIQRWWPAVVWAGIIFFFSTEYFSAPNTGRLLMPFLSWLFPAITPRQTAFVHLMVRKAGHVIEYFIFAVLLMRPFQGEQKQLPDTRTLVWILSTILLYAASDEFHQLFVAGRTPSPRDVLIDCAGALCGILWIYWRRKRQRAAVVSSP
ncbi:MAG TPA: VanZ family protein [Terriglobales bacterium]|nr:VanZ family protein [Terriglobales bacterium]